jgi:Cyclic nucleotide-binding domain.
MFRNLLAHINRFVPLHEDEAATIFANYFRLREYGKKEYLQKEGQVSKTIHFVDKGCVIMYYINNKSANQIVQFAIENWWITDYNSFINNIPSEYYIQTIEKSKIISIELPQLENLLKEIPLLERYFRIIAQRAIAASQIRTKYLYEMSKEEFYIHFCTSFPEFVQRVPQYMIASYLGLTPEYVSELRKKKS